MPMYDFRVLTAQGEDTDETVELHFRVSERPDVATLPDGRRARFDLATTARSVRTTPSGMYPREILALGCHPDQVPEFRRKHPEREFTASGDCIARDASHEKAMFKKAGLTNTSGSPKRRRKGRCIASAK